MKTGDIREDEDGNEWVLTENHGLVRILSEEELKEIQECPKSLNS